MENKENKNKIKEKEKKEAEFEELKKIVDIVTKDPTAVSKIIIPTYLIEFNDFMAKLTPEEREDLLSDPLLIFKNERFRNVNDRIKNTISLYGRLAKTLTEVALDVGYLNKKLNKKLNIKIIDIDHIDQMHKLIELIALDFVHALFEHLTSKPLEEVIKKYATIQSHS